jgi:hypothetical protein
VEENTIRKRLSFIHGKDTSLPNNDLPIAVSTVKFYITLPAHLMSITVFSSYVLYRSPLTIVLLIGVLGIFILPIYYFSRWRGEMIRTIRHYRNNLVDQHNAQVNSDKYRKTIDLFAHFSIHFFWRNVQALFVLRIVVFALLLSVLSYTTPREHSFSVLMTMMLLIASGHTLTNSLFEFQEDKISLNRIKDALTKDTNTDINRYKNILPNDTIRTSRMT